MAVPLISFHTTWFIPHNFGMKSGAVLLVYNIVRQQTQDKKVLHIIQQIKNVRDSSTVVDKTLLNGTCQGVHGEQCTATPIFLHFYPPRYVEPILCTFNVVFILLAFPSLRVSSLTCSVSQKGTHSPTGVTWMTWANSGHLLIEKALYVLERLRMDCPKILFWKSTSTMPEMPESGKSWSRRGKWL